MTTTRNAYDLPETREVVGALTAVRVARGWGQAKLAKEMGSYQSWLCDVETGRHRDPQVSTLIRMMQALGVRASITIYDPHTGDSWLLPLTPDPVEV